MDAHCHRSEYKFTISPAMVPVLREAIARHLSPDRGLASGYLVITEYFDSPDDHCYWQKMDGHPNRRRLRSRIYLDPSGKRAPAAFIEIKHKLDGLTVKRRVASTPGEVASFSVCASLATTNGDAGKVRQEINRLTQSLALAPRVQIRYHRHAYDNGPEGTLRITFDHDVRCRLAGLKVLSADDCDYETPLTRDGESLMEVKTIGPVPGWFRELCGTLSLSPTPFSKYAAAILRNRRNTARYRAGHMSTPHAPAR